MAAIGDRVRLQLPWRWVAACVGGEALGIAAVAITYAGIDRGLFAPAAIWILLAGAVEGTTLGTAQALALRRHGVRPYTWIALTVTGAVAGYALSILGGAGSNDAAATAIDPPVWIIALFGAALGAVMGVLMGALQSPAARGVVRPAVWIAANAIGWMPAMAIIMLAASFAGSEWTLAGVGLLGSAAGALAGLMVGLATAVPLSKYQGYQIVTRTSGIHEQNRRVV